MRTGHSPLLIETALEANGKGGETKLATALTQLAIDDPVMQFTSDPESGQTILKAVDEAHAGSLVRRLRESAKARFNVGAPQVAYHETITRAVLHEYVEDRQPGPTRLFAAVRFHFEPLPRGTGFQYVNAVTDRILDEYLPCIEQGIHKAKETGCIAGFPMTDMRATLIHARCHDVDSTIVAFKTATLRCYREAIPKACPFLLEPIMSVMLRVPVQKFEAASAGLLKRHIAVDHPELAGDAYLIRATAPLASLLGYAASVDVERRDGWQLDIRFDHYAPVPTAPGDNDPEPARMALRAAR